MRQRHEQNNKVYSVKQNELPMEIKYCFCYLSNLIFLITYVNTMKKLNIKEESQLFKKLTTLFIKLKQSLFISLF